MTIPFQTHVDPRGDFWMADGTVIDRALGTIYPVGDGDALGGGLTGEAAANMSVTAEVPSVLDLVLLGGSGANVILSGLGALDGVYRPSRPGTWKKGVFLIVVTGGSAATLFDETDVIAELTTGGLAPAGAFDSTTYGADTYNSASPFTLTGVTETGWPGGLVDLDISITEGTAVGGSYVATDAANFACSADADWTVALAADGRSELLYQGTAVAVREVGPEDDPCGDYQANAAGKLLNPVFPDAADTVPGDVNPFGLLTLVFSWVGSSPDLDIGVEFLSATVGFGYESLAPYMTWSGDDQGPDGSETVVIDLATAWDEGTISTFADVLALADWYPPHGGTGPASLEATYNGGAPVTYALHPGSVTPAETPALALRILADGTFSPVGDDWTATVRAVRRPPVAGVAYVKMTEAYGQLTAVAGPFFAAAMPANTMTEFHFPIATSDGAGKLKQLHTGPIFWWSKLVPTNALLNDDGSPRLNDDGSLLLNDP